MSEDKRRIMREAFTLTRMIIQSLRLFLDTDDYKHLERAYRLGEYAASKPEYVSEMTGFQDLRLNLKSIHEKLSSMNWNPGLEEHAEISHQVTYTIVRANIIANGISFRLKRMRRQ